MVHDGALRAKYGPAGASRVRDALRRLVAADRARAVSTRVVAVDRAATMRSLGGVAVGDPTDGPGVKAAVDAAARALTPHYLCLVGGPDVIPQHPLRNPTPDEDPSVPSDIPYACAVDASDDPGDFVGPTRVVGRLPDLVGAIDPSALVDLVDRAAAWTAHRPRQFQPPFALSADAWKVSTRLTVQHLGGSPSDVHLAPPAGPPFAAAALRSRAHFVNCHGGDTDPRWYGERRGVARLPTALDPATLRGNVSPGTVVAAECCYGAQHYRPELAGGEPSIAFTYLQQGAAGVVGSSTLSYGPEADMGSADLLTRYFLSAVLDGASTGRALLQARQRFATEHGELDPIDLKTLVQFDLLGDPSVTPVLMPVPKGVKGAAGVLLRRRAMARVGESLAETVPRSQAVPARTSLRAPQLAEAAGVRPGSDAVFSTYATSGAVPSAATFHVVADRGGRRLTVVRDEPGAPPSARTVVRR